MPVQVGKLAPLGSTGESRARGSQIGIAYPTNIKIHLYSQTCNYYASEQLRKQDAAIEQYLEIYLRSIYCIFDRTIYNVSSRSSRVYNISQRATS